MTHSDAPELHTDPLELLQSVPFFARVPAEELRTIAGHLQRERFETGVNIVVEGEYGDACYIICAGRAGVVSRDLIGQEVTLATFGPRDHFGEVALVTEGKRTATVRALEPVETYLLRRADFERLQQTYPVFAVQVRQHVDLLAVDSFLRKASPFARLPNETIKVLAAQLHPLRVAAGEAIISEGEEGDRFYLVRYGRVEVLRGGRRMQTLEAGDCFGEVALLANVKRTATVRALEDTELLFLSKPEFDAVVQENEGLRRQLREFMRIRVGQTLARSVAAADPTATLMPHLEWNQRQRYVWLLVGGMALFALLSFLAASTQAVPLMYAALFVGSFVGPVVYVTYLAESHLLPDKPLYLAITFVLAAALGIPLAIFLERKLGAGHGALGSALLVALIEEPAKVIGVAWLLGRSTSRFQMDGLVYGAAAGMGFAAFESVLFGFARRYSVQALLSTLWLRTLLSPFGHGTWTAIICFAIWRQKEGGTPLVNVGTLGAFALSVGLHALWDWQPVEGALLIGWLLVIGVAGLVALREMMDRATQEAVTAIVALNPEAAAADAQSVQVTCRVCGQLSSPGTHYCVRCGAALRR